ncbi:calcyphosin-2-like [Xenia sp. Carnegie-2017]|uniref:calcyphosin-2-like n=1 Tax=Xenia sp. Carnegie-2017 TaxID=2897299 RepID=UPI001F03C43B|nr:calcyphosin-2-like [Xenia sp. Carnegie-2017]
MAFIDLSVKGKASPRHERPFSGKRVSYAYKNTNTKSNIFGIDDNEAMPKREISKSALNAKSSEKSLSPDVESYSKAITTQSVGACIPQQSQLHSTKKRVGKTEERKAESNVSEANGTHHVDNILRTRSRKAPQGVPRLQLGALADKDDKLQNPRENCTPNLKTPDSQTSISWGTPINNRCHNNDKDTTSFQVCSDNAMDRLLSSQRRKPNSIPDLDLQLSHSGNEQFKKALRERNQREKDQLISRKEDKLQSVESWSVQPQKNCEMRNKVADEKAKLRATRKNELIDEALLDDELSRETTVGGHVTTSTSSFQNDHVGPRERRHQALFNRNPTATTTVTQSLLNQRLRFSARVLSKDGHHAHRELNGFYFPSDGTLTVYEFRQFGSRYSAIPFIQHGKYHHVKGKTKDQLYTYQDIFVGNDLVFETSKHSSLPDSLKHKHLITLRITDVDIKAKQELIFKERHSPIGEISDELLQRNMTEDEREKRDIISNVKATVRKQLKKRGVKTLTGLGRYFQTLDTTGDGRIDKHEFKEALKKFNIQIPPEKFDEIWQIVDENHDGALDYGEFMRNFIDEMSEGRKTLVLKVFRKMDANKHGVVPLTNMVKFFNARHHPCVISGEVSEDEVREQLLDAFEHCKKKSEVPYSDFEDYFEGLSLTIDDDDEFTMIMRSCWAI